MKTKEHYLILAVITTILSAPALANISSPLEDEPDAILIGRPFPQLAGIEALHLDIVMPEAEAKKHGSAFNNLRTKVENMLEDVGIDLIPQFYDGHEIMSPALRVDIDMLKLKGSQQYVFRIQTSVARAVYLARNSSWAIQVNVWRAKPVMQAVSVQNMPAAVTGVVLEQVDAFIAAYLAANPPGKQPADVKDIAVALPTVPGKQTSPPVKLTTAKYKFVASKNSKVFHKPDCRWVKRIKPKNLVTYSTRNKAIEAGKRPCKLCKP